MKCVTNFIKTYLSVSLSIKILLALIFGMLFGLLASYYDWEISIIKPLGTALIISLKLILIPIILSTIIYSFANVSISEFGKIGLSLVFVCLMFILVALPIGMLLGKLFLLDFFDVSAALGAVETTSTTSPNIEKSLLTIAIEKVTNISSLYVISSAITLGFILSFIRNSNVTGSIKKATDLIYRTVYEINKIILKILNYIMEYSPIGVFALIALLFRSQGASVIFNVGSIFIISFGGFLTLISFICVFIFVALKTNPFTYIYSLREALLTVFATRTSIGSLPVTLKVMDRELNLDKAKSSLALPLAISMNISAAVLYLGISISFISYVSGYSPSNSEILYAVVLGGLAALGAIGLPNTAALVILISLQSLSIDLNSSSLVASSYALLIGIDVVLDMGRAVVVTFGAITATSFACRDRVKKSQESV